MDLILLLGASVLVLAVVASRVSARVGMPMLLAFIGLGMLFGSDGLFKIPFYDYEMASQLCSACLIFIMFYGGVGTRWQAAKPVAVQAVLLSTLGVAGTALVTGLFCHFVMGMDLLYGLLLGSVLGCTDAASVFSILRGKRLNLKYNTASLLEVESGSNDPCAYLLTTILLGAMQGGMSGGEMLLMLVKQVVFGLALGALVAWAALALMGWLKDCSAGFYMVFIIATALLAYAAPAALGGNGFLGAYLAGILLGNRSIEAKKVLVNFFDGLTSLAQVMVFFVLGLLVNPSQLPRLLPVALTVGVFMTFVARPVVVALLLRPFRAGLGQILTVAWAGLRGASSIVFAVTAVVSDIESGLNLFNTVFCIVLLSISIQGTLLPWVAKRLNMLDDAANVLHTFSDYSENEEVQFLRLRLPAGHPWEGKSLREVTLPPDSLLVLVHREKRMFAPNGDTVLQPGDELLLAALDRQKAEERPLLRERLIDARDPWRDRTIMEIKPPKGQLIVMIQRAGQAIIPRGDTRLQQGDLLVMTALRKAAKEPESAKAAATV